MRQESLLTGRSGRLHGRLWMVDHDLSGVVIGIHGLGDHSGRYESLARYLTTQGWALLSFDLPGHGLSPGGRGRVDSFDGLLADIAEARETARVRLGMGAGVIPQVVLGHSMGGNLAINYVLRRREFGDQADDLAGLVLSAPMLLPPHPPPRPQIFAAWLTGHLFPWLRIGRPVDPFKLTSDPDEATRLAGDALTHSRITVYLGTQLLAQGRFALDHARDVDLPTLVIYGGDDELIDRGACENISIRIGKLASGVCFPGQRHALFHDTGKAEVFRCLGVWLQQVNKPCAPAK